MNATAAFPIVGMDLAKSVFQLAVADGSWRVAESHRPTRTQFERWFANRAVGLVARAHFRSRVYDCRLTLLAASIDQTLALRGESIYARLGAHCMVAVCSSDRQPEGTQNGRRMKDGTPANGHTCKVDPQALRDKH